MRGSLRAIVILGPVLLLPLAGILFLIKEYQAPVREYQSPDTQLVVVCVFDQLRGDYVQRWSQFFRDDGFERIKAHGTWYSQANLPYGITTASPGHASLSTGATPSAHGIVDNQWYDRVRGKVVSATSGDRVYAGVPPGITGGDAPERMLCPTVGDALVAAKKGRVFSLAMKDRAAVLLGGKSPDGAYWFDPNNGEFVTSDYYRQQLPGWVDQFNVDDHKSHWLGANWSYEREPLFYSRLSGPDNAPGEVTTRGNIFPHVLPDASQRESYFKALEASPFGNELLWDFAKSGIESERLGKGDGVDLLFLGFTANGLVGNAFGPDSHEVMDLTIRTDRLISEMIYFLNSTVGPGRYTLVIASDHGVSALPEAAISKVPHACRFDTSAEYGGLAQVLDDKFGMIEGKVGGWIERFDYPWITLNKNAMKLNGIAASEVEEAAAQWATNRPKVAEAAFTRTQLIGEPSTDPRTRALQLSFNAERSGDVYLLPKSHCLPLGINSQGTAHGTLYPYDRHTTLMFYGNKVANKGDRPNSVSNLILGPILYKMLGLTAPDFLAEKLPESWIEDAP